MLSDDQKRIGAEILKASEALRNVKVLDEVDTRAAAMALAKNAAARVVATGGTKQNFVDLMEAAWTIEKGH